MKSKLHVPCYNKIKLYNTFCKVAIRQLDGYLKHQPNPVVYNKRSDGAGEIPK